MHIKRSPAEIHNLTPCDLIGRSITAPLPVISPSSILPPPSPHCTFILTLKNLGAQLKNFIISILTFFFNCVSLKSRNFKFRKSRTACSWTHCLPALSFVCCYRRVPVADATDAPQPWRLTVQLYEEDEEVSLLFHFNGAPVEWNWQGKTEVLGEKPVPVPLCPPQIPQGPTRDPTRASAVRGRRLTAWAMARPLRYRTQDCVIQSTSSALMADG
jgi:hypothetical protein